MHSKIENIVISGGVHGNELSGVHIVNNWSRNNQLQEYKSFKSSLILANIKAIRACRRYIDTDLNRCFSHDILLKAKPSNHEEKIAQDINDKLGPKGTDEAPDLIIDIHNSTANMGVSIIISQVTPFIKKLINHLKAIEPTLRVYIMPEDDNSFPTIAKQNICLEIGPQCHGTLDPETYFIAENSLKSILEFLEKWNTEDYNQDETEIELFTHHSTINYPRDDRNNIVAMLHPSLKQQDYKILNDGENLFIDFSGNPIPFQSPDKSTDFYPTFIGEQAYYEKGVAVNLTTKSIEKW